MSKNKLVQETRAMAYCSWEDPGSESASVHTLPDSGKTAGCGRAWFKREEFARRCLSALVYNGETGSVWWCSRDREFSSFFRDCIIAPGGNGN